MIRDVYLNPWDELVGECRNIENDEGRFELLIGSARIHFSVATPEGEAITVAIENGILKPGARVALLRTDIPSKPLLIRKVDGEGTGPERGRSCVR